MFLGIILSAAFGAIFGSYATLFAHRLPRKESVFGRYFGKKSHCPKCNATLRTRELIPLINWIITGGKCRHCKSKIPRTHLFIELATTISFVFCYLKFGFNDEFITHAILCVSLIILLVTDFTHKIFPQEILNLILVICVAQRVLTDQTIINAMISVSIAVIFSSAFYKIFNANNVFYKKEQAFDYTKLILISSVLLPLHSFLLYFFAVMTIFSAILVCDIATKKNHNNFAYALITPLLWIIFFPPLN